MSDAVYEVVTERILAALERGVVPWKKPWTPMEAPVNITGRAYSGINVWTLRCMPYSSRVWMTFNQAKNYGGTVKKGEKSLPVVYWKKLEKPDRDNPDKTHRFFMLRHFSVFNAEQTEGVAIPKSLVEVPERDFDPITACEEVVAGMPSPPDIVQGGDVACYAPMLDKVTVPPMSRFHSPEAYYATLFHELGHSTGHASRVNRASIAQLIRDDHSYSQEELVAEMTAAFLCGEAGIEAKTLDNAASYIAGWMKHLASDPKCVVRAGSDAQKAADYILARKAVEEKEAA